MEKGKSCAFKLVAKKAGRLAMEVRGAGARGQQGGLWRK